MSDIFTDRIKEHRESLRKTLNEQKATLKDIKEFARLAKKQGVDTADLDELIKLADLITEAGTKQ